MEKRGENIKIGRPLKGKQVRPAYSFREEPDKVEVLVKDFGTVGKAISQLIDMYLEIKKGKQ